MRTSRDLATVALLSLLLACWVPSSLAGCKLRKADLAESEKYFNHQPLEQLPRDSLPANFSWRDNRGQNWLVPSWNQHIPVYCGSCWLHGTLSMIQDRLKIVKNATGPDVMLARQTVLNCGPFHGYSKGCDGGDVIDVIRYMKHFGLPDESCQIYSASDYTKYGKHAKECPAESYCMNCMPLKGKDTCWPVHRPITYFLDAYGQLNMKGQQGELAMMTEIYKRGPITCSMSTPSEFDYGYHRGFYIDTTNSTDVDHDVEVVGWGESPSGLRYWEIRNSWGTYWGELGFMKIQRGVNALQLEAGDCWYVIPSWQDEQDVRAGKLVGSMWGLMTPEEAADVIPEPHRKPHKRHHAGRKEKVMA
ncbi:hypothetical protein N2152v2_001812 [Parachlorella kessleri]